MWGITGGQDFTKKVNYCFLKEGCEERVTGSLSPGSLALAPALPSSPCIYTSGTGEQRGLVRFGANELELPAMCCAALSSIRFPIAKQTLKESPPISGPRADKHSFSPPYPPLSLIQHSHLFLMNESSSRV